MKDISQVKNAEILGSLEAMKRAAKMARNIAIQTNTAVVRYVDGKIVRVSAAELIKEIEAEGIEETSLRSDTNSAF